MKRTDKILTIFYLTVGISFIFGILYTDFSYRERYPDIMNSTTSLGFLQPLDQVIFEKVVHVDRELLFETMTSVENYPLVLPKNVISVKIINQTQNLIFAEEIISESVFTVKILAKHSIEPFQKHTIEIIEGDAKGTKIIQTFEEDGLTTKIRIELNIEVGGLLTPISYFPAGNLRSAMNTVIDSFVTYTKKFDTEENRIVDNLYREILLRPADLEGLEYYSSKLESGKMTINEIRKELLNSDERKYLLLPSEMKTIDELNPKTQNIINNLYQEILLRPADFDGMKYFGSMLENGKMSKEEIKDSLLNSEEKKLLEK